MRKADRRTLEFVYCQPAAGRRASPWLAMVLAITAWAAMMQRATSAGGIAAPTGSASSMAVDWGSLVLAIAVCEKRGGRKGVDLIHWGLKGGDLKAATKIYIQRPVWGIGYQPGGGGGRGGRGLTAGVTRLRTFVPPPAGFAGILTASGMRAVRPRREYSVGYIIVNGSREKPQTNAGIEG